MNQKSAHHLLMKSRCFPIMLIALVSMLVQVRAAEWQWSVEVESVNIRETTAHPRAFLWIPPDCRRVRAVVFAQNNMLEEGILQHPRFRQELAKHGIAEVFVTPTFDYWQSATNNDTVNARFNALLKTLANESGYEELEFAPVIPMGHSASASMPWNFAAWNPERTLAVLSLKGDAPQTTMTGNGMPNLDWGGRHIDGIPGVMVMGEYEWLEERLDPAIRFRAEHPNAAIAMLALSGRGHFDFNDELVDYLARFVRKAVGIRRRDIKTKRGGAENAEKREEAIAENSLRFSELPALHPVDPRSGWLVDRWHKDQKSHAKAAPFAKYSGDKSQAFWAFDREMARLTEKFNASQCCKQPQLLGFAQGGKTILQTDTHYQVALKFEPFSDGVTFRLATTFLDSVDGGSKNCSRWTGLPAGAPLGHAKGGGPIELSRITGPVEQLSADTFAVRFNRLGIPADRRAGDIWLLAEHPGNAQFKSAVQQALLKIPLRLTEGVEQQITFPELPDVKSGTKFVKLNATSDSGEKVCYYVREGPAYVDGNALRLTKIPSRAKFPVKVTVVAWQYGRSIEPGLKTAEPVERTFLITK